MARVAYVMTDAVSFNVLMRGHLEALASEGMKLDLYCGGDGKEVRALTSRKVGVVRNVKFKRHPSPVLDMMALARLLIYFTFNRYDVVIYSTPKAMFLASVAAALTLQHKRVAVVRGRVYENEIGLRRRFYSTLDAITFKFSHKVLFISNSLLQAYRDDNLVCYDKSFVPGFGSSNGVNLQRFAPLPDLRRAALRARMGFHPSAFIVAVVGRVARDKGATELMRIYERLRDRKDVQILIVGACEMEGVEKFLREKEGDRLTYVPFSETPETYLQCADLHLFLTHREGFGNVAVEAAATGLPTFAFDVVGVRDSVIPGVTGEVFAFGDLATVEDAIRAAADDPESFRLQYPSIRRVVEERFSQEYVWSEYAQAIDL